MEFEQQQETSQEQGTGIEDGTDIAAALSEPEQEFVSGEVKKGVNKTLVGGGLLLACVAGAWFMFARGGPKTATAAANPQAVAADGTIKNFLATDAQNAKMMKDLLKNTDKVVQQFRTYPDKTQVPLEDLQTNPFRQGTEKKTDTSIENVSKRQREEERAAALKAVQALQLQSVMHSSAHKACMINNKLYQEGQQVAEFNIEKISPNAVVVKSGIYRFELRMQK